jgi:hypothetical protein
MSHSISSGLMAKAMLAPKFFMSDELNANFTKYEPFEEELYRLRQLPQSLHNPDNNRLERIRELRRILSKGDAELRVIQRRDNPAWFTYWDI